MSDMPTDPAVALAEQFMQAASHWEVMPHSFHQHEQESDGQTRVEREISKRIDDAADQLANHGGPYLLNGAVVSLECIIAANEESGFYAHVCSVALGEYVTAYGETPLMAVRQCVARIHYLQIYRSQAHQ